MSDVPPAAGAGPSPIRVEGVQKRFVTAAGSELEVLRGVDLHVRPGEAVAIVGASGAGKSTLLHILGILDRPTSGSVEVAGFAVGHMSDDQVAALRNRHIGFVFQFHHLLREFSALENVMLPRLISGVPEGEARDEATALLAGVGLGERLEHKPWQLSGGEQQRVAVARALANHPALLLADEPSGNLDPKTSEQLHDLLFELKGRRGVAMVLVTHSRELAARADRILRLDDGRLEEAGG